MRFHNFSSPCSMAGMCTAVEFSPEFETDDSSQNSEKDYEGDDKKLRRREKNRIAAQKSRQKQTQRADSLHQEYEQLERENASLKKEIQSLRDELKQWNQVVQQHEPQCAMLTATSAPLISKQQVDVTDFLPEDWREAELLTY
ncbi:basic leucine zipper transcriptional factor ATF-like 3 [Carcharodon carcharias]|uniref:basic leucine zipper transcriptional factor ATF-like 3 n=1 Tax=Carcharodon carcharias TaxID=13397 RepID=UPI001B7DD7FC|nr:basic leucine zipper transcriptional factor ATF-like 3 [Carcharodon carcharias]